MKNLLYLSGFALWVYILYHALFYMYDNYLFVGFWVFFAISVVSVSTLLLIVYWKSDFAFKILKNVVGADLYKSTKSLIIELPKPSVDTIASFSTSLVYRFTKVGVFTLLLGVTPLIILMHQNYLITKQSLLIEKQNRRLDQQTYLQEADRRSSYVFLLNNIFDKIDEEIKASNSSNENVVLSSQLVARISSLSEILYPYTYLEGDELIDEPTSPERKQLLLTLLNSGIDTSSLAEIFEQGDFSHIDLSGMLLNGVFLKGINLSHSNLNGVEIVYSNCSNANFEGVRMNSVDIYRSNFDGAKLTGIVGGDDIDFLEVSLVGATFARCDFTTELFGNFDSKDFPVSSSDPYKLLNVPEDSIEFYGNILTFTTKGPYFAWCDLSNLTIVESNFGYAYFEACDFRGNWPIDVSFENATFNYCLINNMDTRSSNYYGVEFRGSMIESMVIEDLDWIEKLDSNTTNNFYDKYEVYYNLENTISSGVDTSYSISTKAQ